MNFLIYQWSFFTPDVIVGELREPPKQTLIERGLRVVEFSGEQVLEVYALRGRYKRVGLNDLFALTLARLEGVDLLTGDKHLRLAAEQEGVRVRGVLWALDELVHHRLIAPLLAVKALQAMLDGGRRLPADECKLRLQHWSR